MAEADRLFGTVKADEMVKPIEDLPVWSRGEVIKRHGEYARSAQGDGDGEGRRRVLVLLEGCLVDVGGYLEDHVSAILFPLSFSFPLFRLKCELVGLTI